MIDFVLGFALAGLAVRGWLRGFIRELFDLIGLVVGVWIAFRLSVPLGDFLAGSFGVTPEIARISAGIVLFLLFSISLSVGAHFLSKVMRLPGLNTLNRVGGAGVAFAWGVVLVLVLVNLLRVTPIPEGLEARIEESQVVEAIAGSEAFPQRVFARVVGDSALLALHAIQDFFGASRVVPVGDEVFEFPPTPEDEVRQVRADADRIFTELNRFRTGEGVDALQVAAGLESMAEDKAVRSYVEGRLERNEDCTEEAAGPPAVLVAVCTDVVALAGTALGAFDGIVSTFEGEAILSGRSYDRVGISVVDGPLGRLLVIVLGG